jgi:hypothetical protein
MGVNPISKTHSQLLAEIDQEWANIERICAARSDAEMVTPGVDGEWSIKDTLCHLSAWEKYLLDRLGMVMTGQPPLYPVMNSWDDVHRFNAQVYAENKDRPLTSVIIEFRSLYRGVMTALEALTDNQLSQSYSYDWADDRITLEQLIRANTCEHYREHCNNIERRVTNAGNA